MTSNSAGRNPVKETDALPYGALLAMAVTAFAVAITEALPAGLLPAMSADLSVSESGAGQVISVYAIGIVLATIPLAAATATWSRKRLLVVTLLVFSVANAAMTLSSIYALSMAARFVAGAAGGLIWAILAPYARRIVAPHQAGKALAIAMVGIPVALSAGVPAGTFLGEAFGWRTAFGAITVLSLLLVLWVLLGVPDREGSERHRAPLTDTVRIPGIPSILFVTLVFVLAHFILYTYVATFLASIDMGDATGFVLLVFGLASLMGLWIAGAQIHSHLHGLTVASAFLVAIAALALATFSGNAVLVYVAVGAWGLGWGGLPTLMQTAVSTSAKDAADTAQSFYVSVFNVGMAAGGATGGLLLRTMGPASLPWAVLVLMSVVLAAVLIARTHAFPAHHHRACQPPSQ
ncbi:MFS transporter [Stenotrophomonas rhizophila]